MPQLDRIGSQPGLNHGARQRSRVAVSRDENTAKAIDFGEAGFCQFEGLSGKQQHMRLSVKHRRPNHLYAPAQDVPLIPTAVKLKVGVQLVQIASLRQRHPWSVYLCRYSMAEKYPRANVVSVTLK
jgi:hypothetical protein